MFTTLTKWKLTVNYLHLVCLLNRCFPEFYNICKIKDKSCTYLARFIPRIFFQYKRLYRFRADSSWGLPARNLYASAFKSPRFKFFRCNVLLLRLSLSTKPLTCNISYSFLNGRYSYVRAFVELLKPLADLFRFQVEVYLVELCAINKVVN